MNRMFFWGGWISRQLPLLLVVISTSTLSAQVLTTFPTTPFVTGTTTSQPLAVGVLADGEETGDPAAAAGRQNAENAGLVADAQQAFQPVFAWGETTNSASSPGKPKLPSITLSGVFQVDGVMFNQDSASHQAYGLMENGADFRRARLGAKGSVTDAMDYFLQMDFAFFGRPTFTDLWVDFKDATPWGTIRVGQWKQPFGLESATSFRYTTMMERSSMFQAFAPFRHIGIGLYDHSADLNSTWELSYFRTGQDQFGGSLSNTGGNGLAGRLTHLLWYDGDQGENYLHIGGGYYLNAPPRQRTRFRAIPELYVGEFALPSGEPIGTSGQTVPDVANGTPCLVDTGMLTGVSLTQTGGTELMWVRGPWSWQSEAIGTWVDGGSIGNGLLYGAYSQVGWFLTGEHRPYDRKAGAIDRVQPFNPVQRAQRGWGAWEVAARWSYLDLTDEAIRGGQMENATLGVNWYVNAYCKCVFNYVHSWSNSRPLRNGAFIGDEFIRSETNGFGLRCQVDF